MIAEQESVFWEIIETFDELTLLQYVMLIGSWAEYVYQHYYNSDYTANLRTRDVDFLYINLRKPKNKIDISKALQEKDMQSIQLLLPHLNKERLKYMYEKLFKAQQKIIKKVCFENYIELA